MAALEQSVKDAKSSRKRHPTAHDEDGAGSGKGAPAKATAKKKARPAKAAKKPAKRKSA
jgi:hypothetical protein